MSDKEQLWEMADALMGWHLAHRDLVGDQEEMSLWEISELTGMPYNDIIRVYETAINKCKSKWKTNT